MTGLLKKGLETHTRNRSLDALGALIVALIHTCIVAFAVWIITLFIPTLYIKWPLLLIVFVWKFLESFFKNRTKTLNQKGK